jgi:hypothetical protein
MLLAQGVEDRFFTLSWGAIMNWKLPLHWTGGNGLINLAG